jgi:hypothetical protein
LSTSRLPLAATILAATISLAAGQVLPSSSCDFDGFDTNSKLAEVSTVTTAYYSCMAGKKCLPLRLKPGDPVVVGRIEGDWNCGYLTGRKGSAQGWVRFADIRLVDHDPNPPPAAWAGTWVQGENRIRIRNSKTPGQLSLAGEAYWHGLGDNVHTGEFAGEARPAGNLLHFADGPADSCTIDLALIGKFILANDNNSCGGMNVRFWGIWKRADLQDPLK